MKVQNDSEWLREYAKYRVHRRNQNIPWKSLD